MKKKILIWTVFIVLAFSAGFTLLVYSSSIITRTPLVSPEASADNWDEILANPKPISLQTFSTGTTKPPLSGIVDLENSITKDIEDEIVEVPVKVGLIHHETKGDYLIDAGLDASFVDNPHGTLKGLMVESSSSEGIQQPGKDIASVLEEKEIALDGV
jgi:hypothetical protein